VAYFAVLVAGGIALFIPGPWLASRAFHYDLTTSFLIFGALVNIHHFILDGAIWKLRDGRIASLLLNSKEKVEQAITNAGGSVVSRMRWLAGDTPGARRLQVGAAVLLLAWGTVDQVHHYLSLRSDDVTSLQRAAILDAFDSQLQMRLARKEMENGNSQQAELAWRRAMQASPSDPGPKQALLKLLLEQKRFDEALSLTEASLKYSPNDPNLLLDHGILSLQFDHRDEALKDWNQALKIDPNQNLAHLYLAHELDRGGKAQEAATHYRAFLEQISRPDGRKKRAPALIIGIVLRMADCQARSSQSDLALKSYQMAETLAAATKQPKLESVAAINQAELQAKAGKLDEALALYQKTLQLDSSNGDNSASAVDWFAYGRFLDESGFPERLAYACLLKAQAVAETTPKTPLPESVVATTSRLEKHLGPAAVSVRRNPEPLLQEAIQLRR